ncbi:MAG: CDP-diacylglycerol--glycerol-3-phosphate 3-phosphatidyltransferase [Ruminococcus sp.]|nr:CDP-diacylglycerol--glycerol-3-phosphate 3-phosphatidyltransferase [Ruminococcus sp.]
MNLPNKLTLARVILIPFFLLSIYISFPFHYAVALLIFTIASITDALDGKIARKNNLVTNFGKFLDPLADKVLVIAALAVFVDLREVNMGAVPLIIISAREFMVSGLRLLAANSGTVVAAGIWGKLKTAFTMVAIIFILVWLSVCGDFSFNLPEILTKAVDNVIIPVLIWISVALTVISGGVYLKGYWHMIDSDK